MAEHPYHKTELIDNEIKNLVGIWGFARVVSALARYAHSPNTQEYAPRKFAYCFRRLNAIYEYLVQ